MNHAVTQPEAIGAGERHVRPLFVATIVTGSFLLFLTQPMVARMALPRLGGAPAVWNSAMLVYQALLLAGYAYAHWLTRLRPRRQAGLHLALFAIAALWLPIGLVATVPPPDANPILWVPWFLLVSIGPLFFIVSAQAPLMQRWYALESSRGDPYALYAASNLGSFAGLISYPLIVEPLLGLRSQSMLWTAGYALLVVLVALCALTVPKRAVEHVEVEDGPKPSVGRIAWWIVLAAVPSGLMLSTTTHLTTDIVAMPLLWVLPLGIYLLSFVVAFAGWRAPASFITQICALVLLIAGGLAFSDGTHTPFFSATLGLTLLFVVAVTLHGEMYRLRPDIGHLTRFYLVMSFGGVLGGLFCAIVAPVVFDWAYEHPILVLAAAMLAPQRSLFAAVQRLWERPGMEVALSVLLPVAAFAISLVADRKLWVDVPENVSIAGSVTISLIGVLCIGWRLPFTLCLAALMMSYGGWTTIGLSMQQVRTRSYFGIYEVATREFGTVRTLTHGTTLHGIQQLTADRIREPTTYYGIHSGVGEAMAAAPRLYGPNASVGVIGLGTGTLACYAQPGQSWRFFEIDPAIMRIATDRRRFTFLSRCAPQAHILIGDARLTLAAQPAGSLDILAVDAFSSDAVPMHLLTREAFRVYGRTLRPNGLLLIHISNRYLDLKPVVAANAVREGWITTLMSHNPDAVEAEHEQTGSVWIALSRDRATLARMIAASGENSWRWERLEQRPGFPGWSDDHASILPLLKDVVPW